MLEVCLLGCGGMLPLPHRALTSLMVRHKGKSILVDCGEGNQVSIRKLGWSMKQIDAICFTHYHADHMAGLPGLLLTIGNCDRKEPIHLYGPPGLEQMINGLAVLFPQLPYSLILHELDGQEQDQFSVGEVVVNTLPMKHRVPCLGYSFQLSRQGRFDVALAKEKGVPMEYWKTLQRGDSVEVDGRVIAPEEILGPARKGIKLGYSTDTRPITEMVEFFHDSDLLILEGLYGDNEKMESAKEKMHMTFLEAAEIAKAAEANCLWLTHYSPSIKEPEEYLDQVKRIFEPVYCGYDLLEGQIKFEE